MRCTGCVDLNSAPALDEVLFLLSSEAGYPAQHRVRQGGGGAACLAGRPRPSQKLSSWDPW
jgi:hypothetical protein